MPTPPDPIMPTATADQPGQTPAGDYLAPPPMLKMPDSRSLPILLLCATLVFNILHVMFVLPGSLARDGEWMADLPLSGGLLVLQFFAIFKSHKWPTPALWLALALALAVASAGFFIQNGL